MANPVTHFEIQGADGAKLQQFYRDTFGWEIDANNPMNYGMVSQQGGRGIGGGITAMQQGDSPRVTVYVEVPDPAATLQQAAQGGGKILMEPAEVPGAGGLVIGMFADPEGNVIGVAKEGTMGGGS
jgi:predicted enzyme related to lactoylglutathione lyase